MYQQIGLVGYFGWGNFGDELFLSQWRAALGDDRTFRVNDLLQKPYTSRSSATVAATADAFVIGGGDLIRTESISSLYWNRAWLERPLVISGIGVARESERQRSDVIPRLKTFLATAHLLSLSARDSESKDWIEKQLCPPVEVRLVPDLAFAAGIGAGSRPRRSDALRTIGIVLNKRIEDEDVDLLKSLLAVEERGLLKVRLMTLATGVQRAQEINELRVHGLDCRAESFDNVGEMITAISGVDLLYSAKFHGLVIASRLGIPSRSLRLTSKALGLGAQLGIPQMTSRVSLGSLPTRAALAQESSQLARRVPQLSAMAGAEIERVVRIFDENPGSRLGD